MGKPCHPLVNHATIATGYKRMPPPPTKRVVGRECYLRATMKYFGLKQDRTVCFYSTVTSYYVCLVYCPQGRRSPCFSKDITMQQRSTYGLSNIQGKLCLYYYYYLNVTIDNNLRFYAYNLTSNGFNF